MFNGKRGQSIGMFESIPGILLGAIITIAIVGVIAAFWTLFFNTGGIDSTTRNTFDLVVNDILDMQGLDEPSRNVNIQFEDEYTLVAFSKDSWSVGACRGLEIVRPLKSCEGACICICMNEQGENMCNVKNVICRDFDNIDLDFEGECNLIDGTGEPQSIQLRQTNNKFNIT